MTSFPTAGQQGPNFPIVSCSFEKTKPEQKPLGIFHLA
jgi:hypothetical protein